jgi:hypothetical protein
MIGSRETLDLGALKSRASQSDLRFAWRVAGRYRSSAVGKLWKDVGIMMLIRGIDFCGPHFGCCEGLQLQSV